MKQKIKYFWATAYIAVLVTGTLFHQQVSDIFRFHVDVKTMTPELMTIQDKMQTKEMGWINVERKEPCYCIPNQAVEQNQIYYAEKKNETFGSYYVVKKSDVTILKISDGFCYVIDGITEDMMVVMEYSNQLYDGMRVTVRKSE